jgi:hypothetical protein
MNKKTKTKKEHITGSKSQYIHCILEEHEVTSNFMLLQKLGFDFALCGVELAFSNLS